MTDSTKGLQAIFSRLADFFHIFDLSFFVSGVTSLGAFLFLYYRLEFTGGYPFPSWTGVIAFLIASYSFGLISFTIGRFINEKIFYRKNVLANTLWNAIDDQHLQGRIIDRFRISKQHNDITIWRLYIRLWQELVDKGTNTLALQHLSRYWAMSATYDGVAASLLAWIIVILPLPVFNESLLTPWQIILSSAFFLLASFFCLRQASRYYEYQIEDLVAYLASSDIKL